MFVKFRLSVLFIFVSSIVTGQESYWQQEVNSVIHAELNTDDHTLTGDISVEYINNSPDALSEIYIHLWPNAYKNNKTAFALQQLENGRRRYYMSNDSDRGYINGLDFFINDKQARWTLNSNNVDIAKITLDQPLESGKSLVISTPFHVKIPKIFSRLGYDGHRYHLTQWFPKPAVYDKNGWHPMPYLGQGEFYAEFGNYEVTLTVPANMVVAATGVLQNEEEITWLNELESATRKGQQNEYDLSEAIKVKARPGKKTITFKQDKVHDFAWFASEDFFLLSKNVATGDGNVTSARAYFSEDEIFNWEQVPDYIETALKVYGEEVGLYPYAHCSAVSGGLKAGGGMEYPMITVLKNTPSDLGLKTVTYHEVGHNWFQGMLANNERRHPWLDEGINSFYEGLTLAKDIGKEDNPFTKEKAYVELLQGNRTLQPIGTTSEDLTATNYGVSVYNDGAVAINYLRSYIGADVFKEAMQTYFKLWKFKHPGPRALQDVMEKVSGQNLDWFFDGIINSELPLDYAMIGFVSDNEITVENRSDIPAPFTITYLRNGEVYATEWFDGFTGRQTVKLSNSRNDFEEVVIFYDKLYPESNRMNNNLPKKDKIELHTVKDFELKNFDKTLNTIDLSNSKNDIWLTPAAGWNSADRFMIGAIISNTTINTQPLEYDIIPMFATRTKDVVGLGEVKANLFTPKSKWLNKVSPYLNGKRFHYEKDADEELNYYQGNLGLELEFNKPNPRSHKYKTLTAEARLNGVKPRPTYDPVTMTYTSQDHENTFFFNAEFEYGNKRRFSPNNSKVKLQTHEDFSKLQGEYNYKYQFAKPNHYVNFRAFGGVFLDKKDNMPFRAYFSAIGHDGLYDYDLSGLYFDRVGVDMLPANLINISDGGLKSRENYAFPVDILGEWMTALNVETNIPMELPFFDIGVFGDIAVFKPTPLAQDDATTALYDAGVFLNLKNILKLYYPILLSDAFKPETDFEEFNFADKLVFTINLNPLDFKKSVKKAIR